MVMGSCCQLLETIVKKTCSYWDHVEQISDIIFLQVMAGTGHVGMSKLLRYLRRRNDVDGAISYGNHTAVSPTKLSFVLFPT